VAGPPLDGGTPAPAVPATREDFTGVAAPFLEEWLHAGPLPRFRAMSAALARAAAGR
jgi:hypothetical protein